MPGICGILQLGSPPDTVDRVRRMTTCLVHDTSMYSQATHAEPDCSAHLGWVWDVAFPENAALRWDDAGEIGVLATGDDFSGRLSLLAARYAERGIAALRELNGNASGVILDRRKGSVVLFNDRFGLGRIYWHRASGVLHFASEARALLAVLPETRCIDECGLAETYTVGCTLQNRSLFQGIELLPPASAWTFHRDGRLERAQYFSATEWESQSPLEPAAYTEALIDLFPKILPRYLCAGDGSAMSLTGGLDSRMVLAWAHATPRSLPCYTFGGPLRDCADVTLARRLARATGQEHQTIRVGEEFFPSFTALAERSVLLSDGTMDASGSIEVFCNARARGISPRRITGNYGSEVLRANVAFRPTRLFSHLFQEEFQAELQRAAKTYEEERAGSRMTFILFKQVPWHHYSRRSLEANLLQPISPFLDNDLAALAYRCPASLQGSPQPLLELIARGDERLRRVPTDRSLQLHRLGWVGRGVGRYRELTAKAEYAYDYGMPPALTKIDRVLRPLQLERLFLGRHKFYHFRTWYRGVLAEQIRSMANAFPSLPPPFRPDILRMVVDEHASGRANHTLPIHRLIASQILASRLLSQS